MRYTSLLVLAISLLAAGCGSGVRHVNPPFLAAGTALPVEVAVRHEPQEPVRGTVHYRTSAAAPYVAQPMEYRANQLWAMLPTERLNPDEVVEYYIDVERGDELHALGSPGRPYRVTFLDEVTMILASLRDAVHASDTDHAVRITLSGAADLDQPEAVLLMPGMPAEMVAPMEPDGRGNWRIEIPPHAVAPGPWRYAIEFGIDGELHRVPDQGYRSFHVDEALHHEHVEP